MDEIMKNLSLDRWLDTGTFPPPPGSRLPGGGYDFGPYGPDIDKMPSWLTEEPWLDPFIRIKPGHTNPDRRWDIIRGGNMGWPVDEKPEPGSPGSPLDPHADVESRRSSQAPPPPAYPAMGPYTQGPSTLESGAMQEMIRRMFGGSVDQESKRKMNVRRQQYRTS